jgi:hypothetical protein
MAIDTKHKDLEGLRIDRSATVSGPGAAPWARSIIIVGVAVFVLLGIAALAYRFFGTSIPEVEIVHAAAQGGDIGGVVLTATG